MTDLADINRVLYERLRWGKPYRNEELETKRRSAILWLRHCSKRGWCVDKVVKRS